MLSHFLLLVVVTPVWMGNAEAVRRGANEFKTFASASVDDHECKALLVVRDVAFGVVFDIGHGNAIGYAVGKEPGR